MPTLALKLDVEAAAAEAMSEALLEQGAHSVSVDGLDAPRLALTALTNMRTDAAQLVARAARTAGLAEPPAFSASELPDEDWVRRTQAQFPPMPIGGRLWVGPSWHVPDPARACVRVDPGLAFGTGTHPSTRLTLEFLEEHVAGGESVLDYGCGSGILAIAAVKLGAARADAVDLDPEAVQTAAANAQANGVAVRAASPDAIAAADYDIVVSNILAQTLIVLAPLLAARTRSCGRLALAGILEPQAADVARAYRPWCELKVTRVLDDWVLLEGVR